MALEHKPNCEPQSGLKLDVTEAINAASAFGSMLSQVNIPAAVDALSLIVPQASFSLKSFLQTGDHPTVEALSTASFDKLRELFQDQHQQLLSQFSAVADRIGFVGVHGRPAEAMERFLTSRESSSLTTKSMYFATNQFLGTTNEDRLNDLYGIAAVPIAYSKPNEKQISQGDKTPGGVLVVDMGPGKQYPAYDRLKSPDTVDKRAQYKNLFTGHETSSKGETSMTIEPENFGTLVKGVISSESWKRYDDAKELLAADESMKRQDTDFYVRLEALEELMRQSIVGEILKMF